MDDGRPARVAIPWPLLGNRSAILLALLCITVILALVYAPALNYGLVLWDDPGYVVTNPHLGPWSWKGLGDMFSVPYFGNYQPLTLLSYKIDLITGRSDPRVFHRTNLLLHLCNSWLVFFLFYRLLRRGVLPALIAAMLFAIHPLHVESVAWISGRKDVLYSLFFLGSLAMYVQYVDLGRQRWHWYLSLVLFALSCLAKVQAVVLPGILFVIDFYRRRRCDRMALLEKLPFMLVSALVGLIAWTAVQPAIGKTTLVNAIVLGSYGFIFYLWKMLWPAGLSAFYPYPGAGLRALPAYCWLAPAAVLALAAISIAARRERTWIMAIVWYAIALAPLVQIIPVGGAIVADRYSYISSVGLCGAIGWSVAAGMSWPRPRIRFMARVLTCLVLLGLGLLSRARVGQWRDTATLFQGTIRLYPACSLAQVEVATDYFNRMDTVRAVPYLRRSLELAPLDADALYLWGNLNLVRGRVDSAAVYWREAVRSNPDHEAAKGNLGLYLRQRRQMMRAGH